MTPERVEHAWRLTEGEQSQTLPDLEAAYQWRLADLLFDALKAPLGPARWSVRVRHYMGAEIVDLVAVVDVEPWDDPAEVARRRKGNK